MLGEQKGCWNKSSKRKRPGVVAKETVGSRCQRAKCRLDVSAEREKGHVPGHSQGQKTQQDCRQKEAENISGQDFLWPSKRRCLWQTQGLGPRGVHTVDPNLESTT